MSAKAMMMPWQGNAIYIVGPLWGSVKCLMDSPRKGPAMQSFDDVIWIMIQLKAYVMSPWYIQHCKWLICIDSFALVMTYGDIEIVKTLVQVMACCLAASHYLKQLRHITTEVLWHLHEASFTGNAQLICHWYKFANYQVNITASYPRAPFY